MREEMAAQLWNWQIERERPALVAERASAAGHMNLIYVDQAIAAQMVAEGTHDVLIQDVAAHADALPSIPYEGRIQSDRALAATPAGWRRAHGYLTAIYKAGQPVRLEVWEPSPLF